MDVLFNWLWQGCVIAAASAIMMRAARRASAATRCALWWLALVLVLALPALHVAATSGSSSALGAESLSAPPAGAERFPVQVSTPLVRVSIPSSWSALLFAVWAGWSLISFLRLARALRGLSLARRSCLQFPPDRERRLPLWAGLRSRGRGVRLATCPRVRRAGVLGLRTPVIAVAPDLLSALDDRELDQVVAHEWVHVQRRDDLTVVLQALVSALAGFHPAVWWISRQLDVEREIACDELAVRVTGSVKDYARCLTKLASLGPSASAPRLAPAAASARLAVRIDRLIESGGYPARSQSLLAFSVIAAALLWLAPLAAGVALFATDVGPAQAEAILAKGVVAPPLPTRASESMKPAPPFPNSDLGRPVATPRAREPRRRADSADPQLDSPSGGLTMARAWIPDSASHTEPVPSRWTIDAPVEAALKSLPGPVVAPLSSLPTAQSATRSPWQVAATSGVAVGKSSQKAAVATAGFFNRLGRTIAGSF